MKNNRAFSLLECLLVIALLGVLLLVATPSLRELYQRHQLNTAVERLITAMHVARNAAITRGDIVQLCGSSDASHCDGQWSRGQLLRGEQSIIKIYPALPAYIKLNWRGSFGNKCQIVFNSQGFTSGQQGSFYFTTAFARVQLILLRTGRVRRVDLPTVA